MYVGTAMDIMRTEMIRGTVEMGEISRWYGHVTRRDEE